MANNPIAEISRLGLKDLNTPASASITDVQHLASYNWIEAPRATPTIAVPGSPDLWSPPNGPFRLEKDTGHIYIAQNAARHPESPLEPLFRALYVQHPSFDIASIDVVTDRNNIRKLLGLVNPRWSGYKREDFTIHVEVINNTAIFCREETKTDEYIGPNEFRGYGHSFEEKCTSRRVGGSTGHHRIISYRFGGLKFIVRHETDGYVGVAGTQLLTLQPASNHQAPEVEDLSSVLDSLSLSPPEGSESGKTYPASSKLFIREGGQEVPLPSTLELKTRVAHRPLAFEDVVSQLWVSQTPKLVRAYHTKGVFATPKVEDVAVQVKAWEDQNLKDLRTLAGLIGKIRDVVREGGGRAILKYSAYGDKLVFHKLGGKQMLPKDLYAKWEGTGSNGQGLGPDVKIVKPSV
ncbi:geranylgeranyl pyrophosphate synthetase [Pleomassaria siparia CBS 279.74]|uniref:Geranylgeranyl pyrophosphate synthetase n=1 Tax=Pleomassaria siparia CBS 279.74 TaxID=1314801 RepID=A0A6G1JZT3_9PLEO|nr:geranylgeranyl pyrophosphate synthetase [Pleomassaria siparia CBS 279.74]